MEKTLQDICREAKEYQHLTTQDLADLTDLSSSTISNYFSASSKDPSLYKMGLICAALGVSIDEYFGIVKRPTTEEQLAEAHRAMADADAKHSAALRIAHLEGGMEQLTGSVAKHEKKKRAFQIWEFLHQKSEKLFRCFRGEFRGKILKENAVHSKIQQKFRANVCGINERASPCLFSSQDL